MSRFNIAVTMQYLIPVDTEHAEHYPAAVTAGKQGQALAEAMARFDAETGDEPIDAYSTDQRFLNTQLWVEVGGDPE